ncbi:pentatricopeptide repeat-containing protein [Micractinium conductrix]|uniref:Pentatricopeptide repeat-containing protein n=1 Tax=Micractinium conductrix TaxID=554055 RepID=A0A2P6VD05_9CHLO|nr:pentatricopeptide repeat-containing protein [Micractinium conductrix]|eukprot:PSC71976.1 pentatricopeptide repeat-containing protein [Micractinium conductrix]
MRRTAVARPSPGAASCRPGAAVLPPRHRGAAAAPSAAFGTTVRASSLGQFTAAAYLLVTALLAGPYYSHLRAQRTCLTPPVHSCAAFLCVPIIIIDPLSAAPLCTLAVGTLHRPAAAAGGGGGIKSTHAMADGDGKKPLGRSVESLGWLASSGVQPKKRREIEGVGAASLMAMQAQVARAQQEAALVKEGKLDPEEIRARRRGPVAALLERKNAGVAGRDHRDRLEIKTASDRLSESRAALEKKAALYERLAAGEVDDERDVYEVDFLMKGASERRGGGGGGGWGSQGELDTTGLAVQTQTGGLMHADMARERERRSWEAEEEAAMAAEQEGERRRKERRELLSEVIDEAAEERARAATAREQRQAAEARKRQRLKAAFLQKQLEQVRQQKEKAAGGSGEPG